MTPDQREEAAGDVPVVRRVGREWQFGPLLHLSVTCTVMLLASRVIGVNLQGAQSRHAVLLLSDVLRGTAAVSAYSWLWLRVWRRQHLWSSGQLILLALVPMLALPSLLPGPAGTAAAVVVPSVLFTATGQRFRKRQARHPLSGLHDPED